MWYDVAGDTLPQEPDRCAIGIDWIERLVRCVDPWRSRGDGDEVRRETRSAVLRTASSASGGFDAVRAPDRDEAIEIWRGVLAGRWSLVEHFDAAGRRFVVARRDASAPKCFDVLTPGERRVVAQAAKGHTNKLIAYELNVSTSAVGMRIARAARKLGLRSRVELISAYRRAHAFARRD
jgi:DNA-binding NarL/FixJ family response regulator